MRIESPNNNRGLSPVGTRPCCYCFILLLGTEPKRTLPKRQDPIVIALFYYSLLLSGSKPQRGKALLFLLLFILSLLLLRNFEPQFDPLDMLKNLPNLAHISSQGNFLIK